LLKINVPEYDLDAYEEDSDKKPVDLAALIGSESESESSDADSVEEKEDSENSIKLQKSNIFKKYFSESFSVFSFERTPFYTPYWGFHHSSVFCERNMLR